MATVNAQIPEYTKDALSRIAASRELSLSDVIREALRLFCAEFASGNVKIDTRKGAKV